MLCVVAIFSLVLLGTVTAGVPEFGEDVFQALNILQPGSEKSAQLINSEVQIEFQKLEEPSEGVIMFPKSLNPNLDLDKRHKTCKEFLGIEMEEQIFCKVNLFLMELHTYESGVQTIRFNILFAFDDRAKQLMLEIPAFKIPSAQAAADENQLKTWATDNKVGLAPFDLQQMKDILANKPITVNFDWLTDLLKYKISKRATPSASQGMEIKVENYVSRPVVLSEDIVDELIQELSLDSYMS